MEQPSPPPCSPPLPGWWIWCLLSRTAPPLPLHHSDPRWRAGGAEPQVGGPHWSSLRRRRGLPERLPPPSVRPRPAQPGRRGRRVGVGWRKGGAEEGSVRDVARPFFASALVTCRRRQKGGARPTARPCPSRIAPPLHLSTSVHSPSTPACDLGRGLVQVGVHAGPADAHLKKFGSERKMRKGRAARAPVAPRSVRE